MRVLDTLKDGDSLAYLTTEGWAYAGDRFSRMEGDYLVTKMYFACGAIRFERRNPKGWAVIRGTEVFPLLDTITEAHCDATNVHAEAV